MKSTVSFEFDSPAEAAAFCVSVANLAGGAAPAAEAPKPRSRPKAETPAAGPVASPPAAAPATVPPAAGTPSAPPAEVTFKDVTDVATAVMKKHSLDTVMSVLARHGAKKAGELKPEQFAAVKKDLDEQFALAVPNIGDSNAAEAFPF